MTEHFLIETVSLKALKTAVINIQWQIYIQDSRKYLRWSALKQQLKAENYYCQVFHLRCRRESLIHLLIATIIILFGLFIIHYYLWIFFYLAVIAEFVA